MATHVVITVTGVVPDGQDERAHEVIVAAKDGVSAIVEVMKAMGLTDITPSRRIHKRTGPRAAPVPSALPKAAE